GLHEVRRELTEVGDRLALCLEKGDLTVAIASGARGQRRCSQGASGGQQAATRVPAGRTHREHHYLLRTARPSAALPVPRAVATINLGPDWYGFQKFAGRRE